MRKLISNGILTGIETVLLAVFAILMFFVGDTIIHILIGIALIVYIALVVLHKVVAYRGIIQMIAILEFFIVTTLAAFVLVDKLPIKNVNPINFAVGAAMWLRATTEILHSYHGQGEGRQSIKHFTATKIFFYILLITFGTFIAVTDIISNDLIQVIVASIAAAAAVIMGLLTYCNYRDWRKDHPRPIKPEKVTESEVKDDSEKISDNKPEPDLALESKNDDKPKDDVVVLEEVKEEKEEKGELPPAAKPEDAAVVEYIAPKK